MFLNRKILILLLYFFSCEIIFADNFNKEGINNIDCKELNDNNKKTKRFYFFKKKRNEVNFENCKEDDLYDKLLKSFKLKEDFYNPLVPYYEAYYFNNKKYFEDALQRSSGYISYIIEEVKKRNMPGEIALLPMVESAYNSSGVSRVGATGMWQFMSYTGKNYGLNQTNWYDGRKDFYASTEAALNYLQDLYDQFGDWELAISAYNVGEHRIAKEVKRVTELGIKPTFGNLHLPKETRHYLPKLIAIRNFIINHDFYDLDLKVLNNPSKFVAIDIDQPIDLSIIAKLSGLDIDYVKELNYGYKIPIILPGRNRKLILPLNNLSKFNENLKNYNKDRLSNWVAYKVPRKESIVHISTKSNIPVKQLKSINHLTGNYVYAGKIILIPKYKLDIYDSNQENNNYRILNKSFLSLEETEHDIIIRRRKHRRIHNIKSHHKKSVYSKKISKSSNAKKIYKSTN